MDKAPAYASGDDIYGELLSEVLKEYRPDILVAGVSVGIIRSAKKKVVSRDKSMQLLLTNKGYSCGGIDGDYGSKTRKALDSFQKTNGLTPYDGVCGRGTWRALIL